VIWPSVGPLDHRKAIAEHRVTFVSVNTAFALLHIHGVRRQVPVPDGMAKTARLRFILWSAPKRAKFFSNNSSGQFTRAI
jgi:hypothetical protein